MSVRNTVKSIQDIMRQDVGVDGDAQRISQLCWMFFLKIIDDQDQQLEMMQDGYRSPNLAVRGRLVPQDPNEEPATDLLLRAKKLRGRLFENGSLNECEALAQLRKQEKQTFPDCLGPLPEGWQWATLMQCAALVVDCHNKTAPYSSSFFRPVCACQNSPILKKIRSTWNAMNSRCAAKATKCAWSSFPINHVIGLKII